MTSRDPHARKNTQVVWEDCAPWIDQLYEEHHARVDISVSMIPEAWHLTSAVSISVFVQGVGEQKRELWAGWTRLEKTVYGSAESAVLKMVSQALLELSADKERSERQAVLL